MSLFKKIRNALVGNGNIGRQLSEEFEILIDKTLKEYKGKNEYFWNANVSDTTTWIDEVKNWPDKKKVQFILWLVPAIHNYMHGKTTWSSADTQQQRNTIRQAYLQSLFRNKLRMEEDEVGMIYESFRKHRISDWGFFTSWPISLMLNQLEKQSKNQPMGSVLKTVLEKIRNDINNEKNFHQEKERIKMVDKIDAMLFNYSNEAASIKPARFLGEDPLADLANAAVENMPEHEKLLWYKLLPLAQKATGGKPSKKFLDETKSIIKELGTEKFKRTIHSWLQFLIDLKAKEEQHSVTYGSGYTYNYTSYDFITSVNAEAIKGLIWVCSHFHDNTTIQIISAMAERAFRKIPGKGPTAPSIGNACLYVLYKSKGLDGIGQLSKLRLRIKQSNTQALIDKYLQAAAEEKGVSVSEIEDMAVDDYGLMNGTRSFLFDDYKADLVITGVGKTDVRWFKPDGTPQKSVPAFIKEKHSGKLKKVKDLAKHIEQTSLAQRDRIDRMFRNDRGISWDNFQQYYLGHGLLSYLANRIIWNFHRGDKMVQAIRMNDYWVNASNEIVSIEGIESVSLWHPVQATVDEIRAWREFLNFHQLQQPLKQAYREVYLLTDAELNTRSYSNRMAAHVLRQHQFNSLAKARGWRYALMGAFDNGSNDKATLLLSEHNLRAEYWISEVNADGAMNDTGIWNYVSTDQVRFFNTTIDQTVDLIDIPPLVFSEVMRDVDMFVGVASIGNDPTWQDSGGIPAYRDYWASYSFGELSEVAKNRKEILATLVPRLKLRDVASIKDKFLVVKGKLRTYKIHMGSTNILMEPNDQYLCIVPDRSQKNLTENLFLPFEGDNGLSIILSKAFLLADDDMITDTTITSQIKRI